MEYSSRPGIFSDQRALFGLPPAAQDNPTQAQNAETARPQDDVGFEFETEAISRTLPVGAKIVYKTVSEEQPNTVLVGPDLDFVFVARRDDALAIAPLMKGLLEESKISSISLRALLLEEYERFSNRVLSEILVGLHDPAVLTGEAPSDRGAIEVHVYEAEQLERGVHKRAQQLPVLSLDPLLNEGVVELAVSRLFTFGGMNPIDLTHRPGSIPLSEQCELLRTQFAGQSIAVTDDDVYTGGTLRAVLKLLDVPVLHVLPQIQTGNPDTIRALGLAIDPVVTYQVEDRGKLDIGDVRDFLVGSSGLVVKLPNGNHGRAPYILPFVSPSARASIHEDAQREFSINVLHANLDFYRAIEDTLGVPIRLRHLDQPFLRVMQELYGFDQDAPVRHVLAWALNNIDTLWAASRALGSAQAKLERLQLPNRLVLLDVNGTIFPDELVEKAQLDPALVAKLGEQVARLREEGVVIGLCSDSPREPLEHLAQQLGLAGPIIAENGSVISYNGVTEAVRLLPDKDALEQIIRQQAPPGSLEIDAVLSPEFGGRLPDRSRSEWAFGRSRSASISVFGSPEWVSMLGRSLIGVEGYSIDCAPEYGFLAVHPGHDFRRNKGDTLKLLQQFGHTILMVGNSLSDWVSPESGVQCAFVSGARIDDAVRQRAAHIASQDCLAGVIEILSTVTGRASRE